MSYKKWLVAGAIERFLELLANKDFTHKLADAVSDCATRLNDDTNAKVALVNLVGEAERYIQRAQPYSEAIVKSFIEAMKANSENLKEIERTAKAHFKEETDEADADASDCKNCNDIHCQSCHHSHGNHTPSSYNPEILRCRIIGCECRIIEN